MSTTPASTGRLVAIVVGVVFAIILLTFGGLLVAGYYFASKVTVSRSRDEQGLEKTIRIDTPLGRLRVEKENNVDPKLLGMPIYPGAVAVRGEGGGARVDLDLDFAEKYLRVVAVKMETSDLFDNVVSFYRTEAADFVFSHKADGRVEFRWEHGDLKKIVVIDQRGTKTRISLAKFGEPEAN